jgi:hypothetical protein
MNSKLLLGLAMLAFAPGAVAQSGPQVLLDAHNAVRARHCAAPLTWSAEIAAKAQYWANRCLFDHDPNNELGENLAWGSPDLTAREAVELWNEEVSVYNFAAPGFGPAGHFSQVVWRDTRQLGCARARCQGQTFWVCRYSPPGNVEGEYRANVLPVCR